MAMAENYADSFTDAIANGELGQAKDVLAEISDHLDELPLSQANIFREQFLIALHQEVSVALMQEQEQTTKVKRPKKI